METRREMAPLPGETIRANKPGNPPTGGFIVFLAIAGIRDDSALLVLINPAPRCDSVLLETPQGLKILSPYRCQITNKWKIPKERIRSERRWRSPHNYALSTVCIESGRVSDRSEDGLIKDQ